MQVGSLFGHPPSNGYLFLYCKIFECLRREGELAQDLGADWTWCGAKGKETVYTRLAPISSMSHYKPYQTAEHTSYGSMLTREVAAWDSGICLTCIRDIGHP